MIDWSDENIPYLVLGLLAFWGPVIGYLWSLRSRASHLTEEVTLLEEEFHGRR
ncbi:MAG: hypothetical protein ACRDIB_18420 [Ardenticatenaceae bacterium]